MEPSLGQQLKLARLQRGLSLADVAHATRVPQIRLQYLEDDNLAAFGNLAYARSFARIYSRHLGVDVEPWIKALPRPVFAGAHDYRYLTSSFGPWVEPLRKRVRVSISRPAAVPVRRRWHALMLFIVIAMGSIVLGSQFLLPARNLPTTPAQAPAGIPVPVSRPSIGSMSPSTEPGTKPKLVSFATKLAKEAPTTPQAKTASESGAPVSTASPKP